MATQLIADQHNPVRFRALALFQMAVSIKFNSHEPRENRLGSITGYCGSLQDLFKKACCGNLHNKERCFSQASTCNASCAFSLLNFAYSILDVVTNRSYTENLSRRVKLPYTDWWLNQRNDLFQKD